MMFQKFLLFASALAVGGVLGWVLLVRISGPLNILIFTGACLLLGKVFHWIDQRIS
ncbi:hypothetical protein AALC17_02255 [Oscillospiraceae bacterium 38-13]